MNICPFCHIGSLEKHVLTYTQWYYDQFVVVPGVSTEVCDYCGQKQYDSAVVDRLQQLLRARAARSKRRPNHMIL